MKYLSSIIVILLLTFACKKPEEPNLCTNGLKDIGETGVDCGGDCGPCPIVYTPNLYMRFNNLAVTFKNKSITQLNGDWFINCFNDSIQAQFNLGPDISVGNYTMTNANTYVVYNGVNYDMNSNGNIGIFTNDTDAKRMSGYFNTSVVRNGVVDTMHVTGGEFVDLTY